ncbi:MAG: hypothetical protein QNJ62_08955 [Methyloceanibacter sp.]|nr:hypothetical protein [Methyloceanibacter sp.]
MSDWVAVRGGHAGIQGLVSVSKGTRQMEMRDIAACLFGPSVQLLSSWVLLK